MPPNTVSAKAWPSRIATGVRFTRSVTSPTAKIEGTAVRPRLAVKRSSRHIHVQLIDDLKGHTLAAASTLEADVKAAGGDKSAQAKKVGELIAARAKAAGVEAVVFDRGGNKYHGRVAAIADGAREGGLSL